MNENNFIAFLGEGDTHFLPRKADIRLEGIFYFFMAWNFFLGNSRGDIPVGKAFWGEEEGGFSGWIFSGHFPRGIFRGGELSGASGEVSVEEFS